MMRRSTMMKPTASMWWTPKTAAHWWSAKTPATMAAPRWPSKSAAWRSAEPAAEACEFVQFLFNSDLDKKIFKTKKQIFFEN